MGGRFLVRLICTLNNKLKYPCGLQGIGDGTGWVGLSQARMKKLSVGKGDLVSVKLEPDPSRYGMPVAAELRELLHQDKQGKRRFDKQSPGKQRNIIHYVGVPRSTDRKLERALLIIENLKRLPEGFETATGIFGTKSNFNRRS